MQITYREAVAAEVEATHRFDGTIRGAPPPSLENTSNTKVSWK